MNDLPDGCKICGCGDSVENELCMWCRQEVVANFETDVIEAGPNKGKLCVTFMMPGKVDHIFIIERAMAADLIDDLVDTLAIKMGA